MTIGLPALYQSYSIPDLYLNAEGIYVDGFGAELNSKCGFMIGFESTLSEPKKQTAFSNTFIRHKILESPMMMNLNIKS